MILMTVQYACFFAGTLSSPTDTVIAVRNEMKDVLDGEATLLPVPSGVPVEVPIGSLQSSSGRVRVAVASNRLDLFCDVGSPSLVSTLDETVSHFEDLYRIVISELRLDLSRFGRTASMFYETSNPIGYINKRFFSLDLNEDCDELSFRVNEPIKKDIRYNRVRSVGSSGVVKDGVQLLGVMETLDVNTDQSLSKIQRCHIDEVLRLSEEGLKRLVAQYD